MSAGDAVYCFLTAHILSTDIDRSVDIAVTIIYSIDYIMAISEDIVASIERPN